MKFLLIDLSSVFHPIWHMCGKEPDVDAASNSTVAKVRSLAYGYQHVGICCDVGGSFRKDISPDYKAQRPERDERLNHQLRLARERLVEAGFPLWGVHGYEADDLIATATKHLLAHSPDVTIEIASSDKDLVQLVGPRVASRSIATGSLYDPETVPMKFGVRPDQMRDFLCMVGDASDNVKGVPKVGPKTAAEILKKHGSLLEVYRRLGEGPAALGMTPSVHRALADHVTTVELARKLVTLCDDVVFPWETILTPLHHLQTDNNAEAWSASEEEQETMDAKESIDPETGEVIYNVDAPPPAAPAPPPPPAGAPPAAPPATQASKPGIAQTTPRTVVEPQRATMVLAPTSWTQELEPRTYADARTVSEAIHRGGLFSGFGSPQAVFSIVLAGRELGLGTMASLRGFHLIDGKPCMSSGLLSALVLRSGMAKQFSCVKRSNEAATVRAWRKGEDEPIDIVYTMEDARRAGLVKPGSGWEKNPADMCVARATAIAARLKWQDVCFGLYTVEEMGRDDLELKDAA